MSFLFINPDTASLTMAKGYQTTCYKGYQTNKLELQRWCLPLFTYLPLSSLQFPLLLVSNVKTCNKLVHIHIHLHFTSFYLFMQLATPKKKVPSLWPSSCLGIDRMCQSMKGLPGSMESSVDQAISLVFSNTPTILNWLIYRSDFFGLTIPVVLTGLISLGGPYKTGSRSIMGH